MRGRLVDEVMEVAGDQLRLWRTNSWRETYRQASEAVYIFCRGGDCGLDRWGSGEVVRSNWIWIRSESRLGRHVRPESKIMPRVLT